MRSIHYFLFIFLLSSQVYSVEITEKSLVGLAQKDAPSLDQIESRLLQNEANYKREIDAETGSSAYAGYNHITTKERAVIPFIPIYSPINQYQMGVRKPTKYGVSADLSASVDQRSGSSAANTFSDIHTTIYALTLNFDLWKNLFGNLTRKKLENARLSVESAKLRRAIEKKSFEITVRRLYWSLVANSEKTRISEGLLKASMAQANDARKRERASIADPGEVARYNAQVAQRKGTLLYLKHEREQYLKRLKDLLPKLQDEPITLGEYNLDRTLGEVMQCAGVIQSQKETPMEFTRYDEIVALLKEIRFNQKKIDNVYDDVDVSLAATVKQTGLGSEGRNDDYEGSYEDSLEDIRENDRSGFEAGLFISVPLGKKVNGTEDVIEAYNQKRLGAEIVNTESNITTSHRQISESVKILREVIETQKTNNKQLLIRVKEMRKQYQQARIGVNALIQDEDSLASSALSLVDVQLSVLNTFFDYFSIFTETPCSFNRI